MLPIVLAVAIILAFVLRLTGGFGWRRKKTAPFDAERIASEVAGVTEGRFGLQTRRKPPELGSVLGELMERLGADREAVASELDRMGFSPEHMPVEAPPKARAPHLSIFRPGEGQVEPLERALLVGIQLARTDDDYARVGDDFMDLETLERQAEQAEVDLFGAGRRERYTLYGKAVLALQDMAQGTPEGPRRTVVLSLLEAFDAKLSALQEEMAQAMAAIPAAETLLWGDSRDRRRYYFKMGVINSLRRSGALESLRHLYRLNGVNYDVEEAYRLASEECRPLVLADTIGIDRLLQMGPSEVYGLARQTLPDRS